MTENSGQYVFYGIKRYNDAIKNIVDNLRAGEIFFDIKLLLTEALVNAFEHGNNADEHKPVYLNYEYDGNTIRFNIKDSGGSYKEIGIPETLPEKNLFDEKGRGLFLIKCYSDKVEYKDNTLIIEKSFKSHM